MLRLSSALMLNLSLISANLWSAFVQQVFLGGFTQQQAASFFLSLCLIVAGLSVYSTAGEASVEGENSKDGSTSSSNDASGGGHGGVEVDDFELY